MSLAAPPIAASADHAETARAAAFVGVFALALITLKPFADLRAEDSLDVVGGRDALTYLAFAALAAICVALVWRSDAPALASLRKPAFLALGGWVAVCAALSPDPSTATKRAALCGLVATVAAAAPLLPRGRAHQARLLATVAWLVIGLSYFGVLLIPDNAIHQASDFVEPELAGSWRGLFEHKNDASLAFGMLAFVGLYVAQAGRQAEGVAIAGLSLVFLIFTRGKTATMIWIPVLLLSSLVRGLRDRRLAAAAALAPVVLLNALGVGSVVFRPLGEFVARLPIDSTFTGRSDVWAFAVGKVAARPIAGYGFDTFWNNSAMRFDAENGWLTNVAHAHNGYLDAALSMGAIGLALTLWAFIGQPLQDLAAASRRGADPALTTLFARIWLYGLCASSLETFLFDRANPVWFVFLFALFGLRYIAAFGTSAA